MGLTVIRDVGQKDHGSGYENAAAARSSSFSVYHIEYNLLFKTVIDFEIGYFKMFTISFWQNRSFVEKFEKVDTSTTKSK